MAKVITFSRFFPAYHPRKGEPTYFVEKFIKSLTNYLIDNWASLPSWDDDFRKSLSKDSFEPKHHTIRAGHRFKAGDYFSPRVWSGKPYRLKQIIIAPDMEVKKVWDFKLYVQGGVTNIQVSNNVIATVGSNIIEAVPNILEILATNDGLEWDDMRDWFKIHPKLNKNKFDGQIICWNETVNY